MRFVLVLIGLLVASVALADYDGAYHAGYTFRNGYWTFPGYGAYSRTLVTTPGCYRNGCYVQASSYYLYTPVAAPYVAPTPVTPTYTKDWKSDVLKYAEYRDDLAAFQLTLKALGIQGQQYAFQQAASQGYNYNSGYLGANATTQYGYSLQSLAYGDFNPLLLHQAHAQSVQQSLKLGSDAIDGQRSLIEGDASNRVRVIEALAKVNSIGQAGKSIAEVVKSTQPNVLQQTTTINGQTTGPVTQPSLSTQQPNRSEAFAGVVGAKCAACHSGEKVKGGIDMANYFRFDAATKQRVRRAITSSDPKTRMPPDGPLSVAEMELFFQN